MFEFAAAWEALNVILTPERLAWLLAGAGLGLFVGSIPGLSGVVGMSVLLPFIFGMDTFSGTALLIGMMAVVHTGDTFPAVLLGLPGTSGSQATIMDGYPLARRGEGARALGAAFTSSMIGGVIGAVALFGILSVAKPLVLALSSPELFAMTILGLSMVGVLSRGSAIAGLIVGLIGLLSGMIGVAPGAPTRRFTFDSLYLWDGVPLGVIAIGLFAIPELVDLLVARTSIAREVARITGTVRRGIADALSHWRLVARSSLIGVGVGFIPGLGASVVDWVAYGVTKQVAKDKSQFGKGDIRGVIGPESANNAKEGGALIPALLFAIPGSAATAILLVGLMMMGIESGPSMVEENLPVTLAVVWSLALANVVGAIGCLLLGGVIARVTNVSAERLVPFLMVFLLAAAYQSTRHWGDIIALVIVGVLGWTMKQVGWPRAPMLIGAVLALPSERYLHISMNIYGYTWLTRPGVLIIFGLTLVLGFMGAYYGRDSRKEPDDLASGGSLPGGP